MVFILMKYIYIYMCVTIPLFCPYRALMVDIFIIFRVQHFFLVNSDIFIIFRVRQVQLQKVPLNGKKGGFRGAQRVEKGVLG